MKKKIFLSITSVLCVLACVLSISQVIRITYEYKQSEKEYDDLANVMVSHLDADLYVSQKEDGGAPIDVNFEALKAMNANVVGWLYCPGTQINYPVVQSSDNSYYLTHLYDNQSNSSGTIFMDARNSPDLSNINTIIYGHNMKNGSMFASLQNYDEQWYYNAHPVMYYITNEHDYQIDVFASFETTSDSDVFTIFFPNAETYGNYMRARWGQSRIDTSWLPMSADDNIITLTTCSYGFEGARYVVQGKVTKLN